MKQKTEIKKGTRKIKNIKEIEKDVEEDNETAQKATSVHMEMLKIRCVKMCKELSEERKKSPAHQNRIRGLNKLKIEHKEIKNNVFNVMKVIDDSANKLLNSACANPYKIMSSWLSDELNNVVTEIEM